MAMSSQNMNNTIINNQNKKINLRRIAAQRQLYSRAKTIFGIHLFLSIPVTAIFITIAVFYPFFKVYAAIWGIFLTIIDLAILSPWQEKIRDSAARIQELFDCQVLGIEWNTLKVGIKPDPELIKEESDKYISRYKNMPPIKNWYQKDVGNAPLYIGRIICQRSNCWWDSSQRKKYAFFIFFTLVVMFSYLIMLLLWSGLNLDDLIVKVVAPISPLILLGVRQYREQNAASQRLQKLKEHAGNIWGKAVSGEDEKVISLESRNLQDEIFESRKKNPPVFDFVFTYLRSRHEGQSAFSAAEHVREAREKLIF